jgi:hypothetical protein
MFTPASRLIVANRLYYCKTACQIPRTRLKSREKQVSRFAGKERKVLCRDLVEPAIRVLGFEGKQAAASAGKMEPHYRLYSSGKKESLLALCLVYPWDRSLDGKDDRREIDAYTEAKKRHKPGTFLIQHCLPGESAYTQTFYSRVIFG